MARMYDDSLSAAVKINKQNTKAETKKTKYTERSGFPWWMLFLAIILVAILLIIKQFKMHQTTNCNIHLMKLHHLNCIQGTAPYLLNID